MKRYFSYLLFLTMLNGFSQNLSKTQLEHLEYEELLEYYDKLNYDSIQGEIVARVYLDRARNERDTIKMARGYDRLARLFHPEKNIAFADSIIDITKRTKHKTFPAMGYMLRAFYFNKLDRLELSMTNYLLAYDEAEKNDNWTQQVYVSDILISLKTVWGNKKDALKMQRERHSIVSNPKYIDAIRDATRKGSFLSIEDEYYEDLILSFETYAFCFLNLKQLDSAKYYSDKSRKQVLTYNHINKKKHLLFINHMDLEITYFENNFEKAIEMANELLNSGHYEENKKSLLNIYLIKGLASLQIGHKNNGLNLLRASDSIFELNRRMLIHPQDRLIFTTLLDYYKETYDLPNQIIYLNKLIYVDSVLKRKYKYFEPDMLKKFETPKLLAEKERLITSLEQKNSRVKVGLYSFVSALIISICLLAYYINRQKIYKKRYQILAQFGEGQKKSVQEVYSDNNDRRSEVSTDVVDEILAQLDKFERKLQFLSMEINLHDLAKSFNTNPNYLSRVINLKMEKNFSQYINDLRVVYIMNALNEDSKLRKYSIKAIANECGFRGSDSFSRAFYKHNGIYPSFYIKQMNKEAS